jgi:hypothetical protein
VKSGLEPAAQSIGRLFGTFGRGEAHAHEAELEGGRGDAALERLGG